MDLSSCFFLSLTSFNLLFCISFFQKHENMRNNLLQLITKVRKRIRIHIFIRNELLISNLCIIYDHFIHDRAIESIFFLKFIAKLKSSRTSRWFESEFKSLHGTLVHGYRATPSQHQFVIPSR